MNIISDDFERKLIENVINNLFPNLISIHKSLLLTLLKKTIETITIAYGCNLEEQFCQNNYMDAVALLLMLLPFINDDDGSKKKYLISLDDLYIEKNDKVDISLTEPKYKYTNIQYNRCKRNPIKEIKFNEKHLWHNYILLRETIISCANKLHPNWIDIFPQNLDTYKTTNLYINTKKLYDNKKIGYNINFNKIEESNNLNINEIYDTLANDFYFNIKSVRWIMYDVRCNSSNDNFILYPLIIILNSLINLNYCINDVPWDELSDNYKLLFEEKINDMISHAHNNTGMTTENLKISANNVLRMITALFEYFNTHYQNNKLELAIIDGYMYIEDFDKKKNNKKLLHKLFISLKPYYIYDFIKDCLNSYKQTWFGHKLFVYKKNIDDDTFTYQIKKINEYDTSYLSIKLLYNYAKSICNETGADELKPYPNYWRSLNIKQKILVVKKLNDSQNNNTWFNLGRYITNILETEIKSKYTKNLEIYASIRKVVINAIFETLILSGSLTVFYPNPKLTNKDLFNDYENEFPNEFANNLKKLNYSGMYHYLLGVKYEQTNITYEVKGKIKTGNYIDFLIEAPIKNWCQMYAMNWISQIAFFHKYLNNRVIFITGGTGAGKSTQMPKLFLYALKVIEHKKKAKVICTIPRIVPVISTATRVADELGVNINIPTSTGKINSDKFMIQYEYNDKTKSHINEKEIFYLKFITDKSLCNTLISNPLLKIKRKENYTNINLFDVIVIDEAHEHNVNMDIILTLAKYSVFYNNSIKLVIMSATMEDDEPTYRRYYRDINDNYIFPINTFIEKNQLDRINVDRRLHVSVPGQKTRFLISEVYEPKKSLNNIVMEILSKNTDGDILIFQPGMKEILDAVSTLNKITPHDVLAIPYYSEMNDEKKDLIININAKRNLIRTPKDKVFEEDDGKIQMPENYYKKLIIVSTNLAETSLSITSLKYVIDTGTQKINRYEPNKHNSILEKVMISESSRLQRRGRVGRSSSGTAYFMYEEKKTEYIKKVFPISDTDITSNLLELLRTNKNDELLITPNFNPSLTPLQKKNLKKIFKYGIDNIIEQYFNNDEYCVYYGRSDMYDYKNSLVPMPLNQSGYTYDTLLDVFGSFYIIHPDELFIKRNILGVPNEPIISNKLDIFFKKTDKLILTKLYINDIYNNENIIDMYKTEYCKYIYILQQTLDIDDLAVLISYAYSRVLKCSDDMIKLISMCISCNYDMKSIKNYKQNKNGQYTNFNIIGGDIYVLLDIAKKIYNDSLLDIHEISKEKIRNEITILKKLYFSGAQMQFKLKSFFDKMKNKKILNNLDIVTDIELNLLIKNDFVLIFYTSKIENIKISSNNVNDIILSKYFNLVIKMYNNISKNDDLTWFENNLQVPLDIIENEYNIIISLIYGNMYQIVKHISKNKYTHVYDKNTYNVSTKKYVHEYDEDIYKASNTLLNNNYSYAIYLKKNIEFKTLSVLANVPEDILYHIFLRNPIYYEKFR